MAPSIPSHSTSVYYLKTKGICAYMAGDIVYFQEGETPFFTCQCLIFLCLPSLWIIHCVEGLYQWGASSDVPKEHSNTGVIWSLKVVLKQQLSSWTITELVIKWSYFARSQSGEQMMRAVPQSACTYVQNWLNSCSFLLTTARQFWTGAIWSTSLVTVPGSPLLPPCKLWLTLAWSQVQAEANDSNFKNKQTNLLAR